MISRVNSGIRDYEDCEGDWTDDEKYFEIDESLNYLLLDLSEMRNSSENLEKL